MVVAEGVVVGTWVPVVDAVGVGILVGDNVGDEVEVVVGVSVGCLVRVGEEVGVGVVLEVGVEVDVGMAVAVGLGVMVLVGLNVRVGVLVGVDVACEVLVRVGVGWLPIRTMRRARGPTVPPESRTWTATSVSPFANDFAAAITRQNCVTNGSEDTNVGEPNASTVQARRAAAATVQAQEKSFNPLATC